MKYRYLIQTQAVALAIAAFQAAPALASTPADPCFRDVSSCSDCRSDEQCGGSLFSGFTCHPRDSCDLTEKTTRALVGDFIAHVDFGAGLMNDRLRLALSSTGTLSGAYAVPGGFTSPVRSVSVDALKARFSIVATENGTSTVVDYALERDDSSGVFSGSVSEHGQRIGSVTLERASP